MAQAEGLHEAPGAVVEVEAEGEHGQDVEPRDERALEPGHEVVVRVAVDEVRMDGVDPEREVHQVVDDEEEQDDAAPAHRARGVAGLAPLHLAIAHRPRGVVHDGQAPGRPDVQRHRDEQDSPRHPQQHAVSEGAQGLGVAVERLRAQVDLQVPEHVADHEAEEDHSGQGHHDLEAEGGPQEAVRVRRSHVESSPCFSSQGGHSRIIKVGVREPPLKPPSQRRHRYAVPACST
jgi:hypothetical protein